MHNDRVAESFDIHSVKCTLHVECPKTLQVDWASVCRSIPKGERKNCHCNQTNNLEIKIDNCMCPNIKDNTIDRQTVVTVSKAGISVNDLRRLANALIQRCHLSKGLLSVHSVIVGLEGRAIALLGGFGDGKTITSLKMIEKGATLLAGDLGLLDIHVPGKQPVVVGGSRSVMIRPVLLQRYFKAWYNQWMKKKVESDEDKVDISELVGNFECEDGAYELVCLAYVKVSPANREEWICERIHNAATRWPVINFWQATGYYFDQAVVECNYPLTNLQAPSEVEYRWICSTKVLKRLPVHRLFGSLDYVAKQAMELLHNQQLEKEYLK